MQYLIKAYVAKGMPPNYTPWDGLEAYWIEVNLTHFGKT